MAAAAEIFNFVDKFSLMTSQGFQANLTFSSYQGRVSVNFNADLGYLMPNPVTYPKQPYEKSTQGRRRQRCAQARKKMQSADASVEASRPDLAEINSNYHETRDVTTITSDDNFTSCELIPIEPLMLLSKDDATIEYLDPQPTSQSNDPNMLSTSILLTPKMCCSLPCCSSKKSPARNCPGPDVVKTTFIRCCYHK